MYVAARVSATLSYPPLFSSATLRTHFVLVRVIVAVPIMVSLSFSLLLTVARSILITGIRINKCFRPKTVLPLRLFIYTEPTHRTSDNMIRFGA